MSASRARDAFEVYAFDRAGQGEIRVQLARLGGRLFVDVRLWAPSARADGFVPTRKGVSIPAGDLPQLMSALTAASAGVRTTLRAIGAGRIQYTGTDQRS